MPTRAPTLLTDMLSLPTTSFAEQHVIDYVRRFCADRPALHFSQDRAGNVRIRLGRASRRPLVFAAHLDHPGFVADAMIGPQRLRALWFGGVRPEYFDDAAVRFAEQGRWVRGHVATVTLGDEDGPRRGYRRVIEAEIDVARPVSRGAIGMWDFPDPVVRGSRIHARGCDDVAGAAAALACLDALTQAVPKAAKPRARRGGPAIEVLLTRAEEVGFAGAIAACREKTVPAGAFIVGIETSSVLPGVHMGGGPILRVGDALATYEPAATAYVRAAADAIARDDATFRYQRKLMDGGVCESTIYAEFGYTSAAICIALGNYHNMDAARGRLAAEYIDLDDWHAMVRWFVALATTPERYDGRPPGLRARLRALERRHRPRLYATARTTT